MGRQLGKTQGPAGGKGGRAMLAPTMKLQNCDIFLRKPESFACRGLHCSPANGAGVTFGVSRPGKGGCSVWVQGETQGPAGGKGGRSQAPPLRRNCEMAIKFKRTLSRFMVGVGLCSTRGALRQHKALADEQCSPLRRNCKKLPGRAKFGISPNARPGRKLRFPWGVSARNEAPTPKALS